MSINPMLTIATYPLAIGAFIRPDDDAEKSIGKYLSLTATEACHLLGTVIGAIETVFWGIVLLPIYVLHIGTPLYFPVTVVHDWVFARAGYALLATSISAVSVAYNFFATQQEIAKIEDSVISLLNLGSVREAIAFPD